MPVIDNYLMSEIPFNDILFPVDHLLFEWVDRDQFHVPHARFYCWNLKKQKSKGPNQGPIKVIYRLELKGFRFVSRFNTLGYLGQRELTEMGSVCKWGGWHLYWWCYIIKLIFLWAWIHADPQARVVSRPIMSWRPFSQIPIWYQLKGQAGQIQELWQNQFGASSTNIPR